MVLHPPGGTEEPALTSLPGALRALEAAVCDLETLAFRGSNRWGQHWRNPAVRSALAPRVTDTPGALPPPARTLCSSPASPGLPPLPAAPSGPRISAAETEPGLEPYTSSLVPLNGGVLEICGGHFGVTQWRQQNGPRTPDVLNVQESPKYHPMSHTTSEGLSII